MKKFYCFATVIYFVSFIFTGISQDYHVRIGFIGNSITIGSGLTNPATECYPAQLNELLKVVYGDTCIVGNFAVSGRTMLKYGDYPIWNEPQFRNCWNFAPEILFILLGTNDTKPYNWDLYGNQFYDDYASMIDTFKVRNPSTKFIVCYPPPAYEVVWDIRDSIIVNGIIPAVDSIVEYSGATLIDFYHSLMDSISLFPDFIHPGVKGAGVMARIIMDTLIATNIIHKVDTGLTFVSSLKTDKKPMATGDSATLSWTTVNADSVFLNGQSVPVNGSYKVSPSETMIYTLLAKGKKSVDSMKLEQEVYEPYIARLTISPRSTTIDEGDTVILKVNLIDQENKIIYDDDIDIDWSVIEGTGILINEEGNSISFIAGSAGRAVVLAMVDTLSVKSTITIKSQTGMGRVSHNPVPTLFPNPVKDGVNIQLESSGPSYVQMQIFDLNGTLVQEEHHWIAATGMQSIAIDTKKMNPGTYVYKIGYAGEFYTGKITIQQLF
ncbi:MAG: T9SS type A sorting domain-containing protein [Bacteroidales bacterium]|nr:T9SS type A sorting domain-containing protein [Bacteroidales bacterium]